MMKLTKNLVIVECTLWTRCSILKNYVRTFTVNLHAFAFCILIVRFVPWSLGTIKRFLIFTAWKVSVFRVFLVCIFPYLDWIRRDTPYLSVFSPDAGKYGPQKLRIQTLFTQWLMLLPLIFDDSFPAHWIFVFGYISFVVDSIKKNQNLIFSILVEFHFLKLFWISIAWWFP